MDSNQASPAQCASRREFLHWTTAGLGGAALAALLGRDRLLHAAAAATPGVTANPAGSAASALHFPAKAKRAIHIYLCGGLSQVDSFDYKPDLYKSQGKALQSSEKPDVFFGQVGLLQQPLFDFKQRGQSGLWVSELFPNIGRMADELTVIRSMHAETSNHTPATFQANTGFRLNGFPTLGAWLSYGMGSECEDLPTYVVLPDTRGVPAGGSINWSNGFLPAQHQGVPLRSTGPAVNDLFPARPIAANTEQASRAMLAAMNQRHLAARGGASDALSARIRSYELAARVQLAVPEVTDLARETPATHAMYGTDRPETVDFGRNCLLARRLLEQGVRFVQIFSGSAFGSPRINWDGHEDCRANHAQEALRIDRPIAGLLADLRQRGMLDDTLVLFTTEFGRTPFTQAAEGQLGKGRDHNQYGFSVWMAGAGLRHGTAYGETDDVGWRAATDRVDWHDFHATVLHLLGMDHERLTYYHNGIQRRLTNVHGHPVRGVLA